jgi:hypothetical protein
MKMPDRDYPFADMKLGAQPEIDNGPGWVEVVYAFITMVLMAIVILEAMLF